MNDQPNLHFFQTLLELLGEAPEWDRKAIRKIARFEEKHGLKLPAAVREWYSLLGADGHLVRLGLSGALLDLSMILANYRAAVSAHQPFVMIQYATKPTKMKAGETSWDLRLNGSDDPALTQSAGGKEWGSFSRALTSFAWSLRMCEASCQVHLPEKWGKFDAILLDYLLERLQLYRQWTDPPRPSATPPFPGRWHYDFFTRRALLQISCEGDPADESQRAWWHLYARTEDDLFELACLIWPGAGLPLRSVRVERETVLGRLLERLREYFRGTGHDGI